MNAFKTAFTKPAYTGMMWLLLRAFVGYEFLSAGIDKVSSGTWIGGNAIGGFLQGALKKGATGEHPEVQGWYVGLVNDVFLPNATLFSSLVAIGEVAVGVALILGIFTKFSAAMGSIMNIAFLAAGTSSSNPQMLVMQVAMVFAGAGVAYYGVDYFLMPFLKKTLHIGEQVEETQEDRRLIRGSLPTPRPVH